MQHLVPISHPFSAPLKSSPRVLDKARYSGEHPPEDGKFVVNVPQAGMEDAVMITARNYLPEVDEFGGRPEAQAFSEG